MRDCVFCRIVGGEIPATRLYEDEATVAFRDLNPAAPSHALVVPRTHISTLDDAVVADQEVLGKMVWAARAVAAKMGLSSSGYRLVINTHAGAGQSVFHIHIHVLGGRSFAWPPG